MSATNTIHGSVANNSQVQRPTLGDLQGTVIQAPVQSIAPSAVFQPVTIPHDAQTSSSSITMESVMQRMEKRDAKQAKILETMLSMMSTIAKQTAAPSPSLEKAGQPP